MLGKIIDKKQVAQGTLQVTFEVMEDFNFKPGQYVFVTMPELLYSDERGPRRQFSINNNPSVKNQIIITTRLSDSGFKKTLSRLPLGTTVELGPIAGVFTLPEDTSRPLVFIAGGIGITPFMSMLRHLAKIKSPFKITLIYSNRNRNSTAFLEELKLYEKEIADFNLIATMTDDPDWEGEKRIVNSDFIKEYFPDVNAQYYMVVGPPGMVSAVEKALLEAGVMPENIKKENFTGY